VLVFAVEDDERSPEDTKYVDCRSSTAESAYVHVFDPELITSHPAPMVRLLLDDSSGVRAIIGVALQIQMIFRMPDYKGSFYGAATSFWLTR
jgi:hypothetical protein